jgi:hypothetical protein
MRPSIRLALLGVRKPWAVLLFGLAVFALAPPRARADIITFEPDDFAPGAYLSTAMPGVQLWGLYKASGSSTFSLLPVYAWTDPACAADPLHCYAVTGTQVFRSYPPAGQGGPGDTQLYWQSWDAATFWRNLNTGDATYWGGFNALLIEFDSPTDFVSISGAFFVSDWPEIYALDASFNLLPVTKVYTDRRYDSEFNFEELTTSVSTVEPQIKYAIAGGWYNGSSLDALRYESIPEPSSLLLLGTGLAGLVAARRRRR